MSKRNSIKRKAYLVAVGLSLFLTIIKLSAGFLTSTWSVVAMGMDSFLDILFTNFNFFLLKIADKPADRDHPLGHGKFEEFSVIVQSVIIFLLGLFMLKKGITDLIYGTESTYGFNLIVVMSISVAGSFLISTYLKSAGKKINSSALIADAKHYTVDILSNGAILIGVTLGHYLNLTSIDSILTAIFSIYIMISAVKLFLPSFKVLTDHKLSDDDEYTIEKVLQDCRNIESYHSFVATQTGSFVIITAHIVIDYSLSLREAHQITDNIEKRIKALSPHYKPTIHADPSDI
jgi:cation diffusion facilitator family transporter